MRRSRRLPIETMAAISLVVAASLLAVVVVVRDAADGAGTDRAALEAANRSPVTTVPSDPATPADETTTTAVPAPTSSPLPTPTPTTDGSDGPHATPTSSTTTSTTAPPRRPPTTRVEAPPECPGLVSETYWAETGAPSALAAAAGSRAEYAEVVTNESDEPCTLSTNRCGSTAQLRTADGAPTDPPPRFCTADATAAVVEPGDRRTERLTVRFPVPPGDYEVHIRRYDGTSVVLPVQLDDRLPACEPETLGLQVSGDRHVHERSELRDAGLRIDLLVTGVPDTCTVRTVESRLRLDLDGEQIEIVDAIDRWLAEPDAPGISTHVVVPAGDIPAGEYDGRITMVLEAGDRLVAPFGLVVR